MNKKMRELLTKIQTKTEEAKSFLADGENKDIDKANAILDEVDALQKEYDTEARLFEAEKASNAPDDEEVDKSLKDKVASGFKAVAKMIMRKPLDEKEKALVVDGSDGENNLLPEDVRLEINELRKQYKSAKDIVNVMSTTALTGSVNYESGTPAGLAEISKDGDEITTEDNPSFVRKTFKIRQFAKLIPISRLLQGAEKAGLMSYLNKWFIRNAIISENKEIFAKLKEGKSVKAVKGWEALKKSITVDLDPDALIDTVIVTNQTGFALLDAEKDENGRPILQPNPANPTQKLFQGFPVEVFADRLLPLEGGKAPIIYGATKAGCSFVDYEALEFAVSEHYFFGKNQNCIRVIEGFDVMSTDNADTTYIYGTFEATPEAPAVAKASARK